MTWNLFMSRRRQCASRKPIRKTCKLDLEALEARTLLTTGGTSVIPLLAGGRFAITGDFVGHDGRDDILTRDFASAGGYHVYQRLADGTFHDTGASTGFDNAIYSDPPTDILTGDFIEDGNVDVITRGFLPTDPSSVVPQVFKGIGDGTFERQGTDVSGGLGAGFLNGLVGDVNGDSHLDVVVSTGVPETGVQLFSGHGDGTFTASRIATIPADQRLLALKDFAGDGKLDLVTVTTDNSGSLEENFTVYTGHGDGTFSPGASLSLAPLFDPAAQPADSLGRHLELRSSRSGPVLVGNFAGDSKPDIAVAYYDQIPAPGFPGYQYVQHVALFENTGAGFSMVSDKEIPSVRTALINSAVSVNLNGDGYDDIVLAPTYSSFSLPNKLFALSGGSAGLSDPGTIATEGLTQDLTVGDFNGDHKPDLVVTTAGGAALEAQFPSFHDGLHVLLNRSANNRTTTTLTPSQDAVKFGEPVSFTISVQGTSDHPGQEDVVLNDAIDNNGTLTTETRTFRLADSGKVIVGDDRLAVGLHTLTASYAGDDTFAGSTSEPARVRVVAGPTPVFLPTVMPSAGGDGASYDPVISYNGRFVAFVSTAGNLDPTVVDDNGLPDVYVTDLKTGKTELISGSTDHVNGMVRSGNAESFSPVISYDGRFVAFLSQATNLRVPTPDPNDPNAPHFVQTGGADVYLYDRETGINALVSGYQDPSQPNTIFGAGVELGELPTIGVPNAIGGQSPLVDVAFTSRSEALSNVDHNGHTNVFLYRYDPATSSGQLKVVSVNRAGTNTGNQNSSHPILSSLSANLVFLSEATDLDPGKKTNDGYNDVFFDHYAFNPQVEDTIQQASVNADGVGGNAGSLNPHVVGFNTTQLGGQVVFDSAASNLVSGDNNGQSDVFEHFFDIISGQLKPDLKLVSARADGSGSANGPSFNSDVGEDSGDIVFQSGASNLQTKVTDDNGVSDVYLYNHQTGETQLVSVGKSGTTADPAGGQLNFDPRGHVIGGLNDVVVFTSDGDLDPAAPNKTDQAQILVRNTFFGKTTLLSRNGPGIDGGNGASGHESIGNGSGNEDVGRVAYQSDATDLLSNAQDNNDASDVFAVVYPQKFLEYIADAASPPAVTLRRNGDSFVVSDDASGAILQSAKCADVLRVHLSTIPQSIVSITVNVHDFLAGATVRLDLWNSGDRITVVGDGVSDALYTSVIDDTTIPGITLVTAYLTVGDISIVVEFLNDGVGSPILLKNSPAVTVVALAKANAFTIDESSPGVLSIRDPGDKALAAPIDVMTVGDVILDATAAGATAVSILASHLTAVDRLRVQTGDGDNTLSVAAMTDLRLPVAANGILWDAGAGNNTLTGPNIPVTWRITGTGFGSILPEAGGFLNYSGVTNLVGGSAADTFKFDDDQQVAGDITGGDGTDVLDYTRYSTDVSVDLASGTATGVGGHVREVEKAILKPNSIIQPNPVTGGFLMLVSGPGTTIVEAHTTADIPLNAPAGATFPIGLVDFTLSLAHPGDATTVTLPLPADVTVNHYYRFGREPGGTNPHWYEFDDRTDAQGNRTGAEIDNVNHKVTLHFVDGKRGDDDLAANGVVTDPGGPAVVKNPGTLQFSAPTYTAAESGGTVRIQVTRTGGSDGAVAAGFAITGGTATLGTDYTLVSSSLSFADGQTRQEVLLHVSDDALVEGDETVTFRLSSASGGANLGTPSDATLTITDNDAVPPPPPPVVLTPSQHYVVQLYRDLLHRLAEAPGLAYWSGLLDHGVSRLQVVQAIEASPEHRIDQVEGLYQTLLRRPADPLGLVGSLQFLAAGGTEKQLKAIILGSPEYLLTQGGGSNLGFLIALYRDVLGRPLDPFGAVAFTQALAHGASRTLVALVILQSVEGEQVEALGIFSGHLGRPADPLGLTWAVNFLQAGGQGQFLLDLVLASDEYFAAR